MAWVGLLGNLAYFSVFCLPHWEGLIRGSEAYSLLQAASTILLFAVVYNCHSIVQVFLHSLSIFLLPQKPTCLEFICLRCKAKYRPLENSPTCKAVPGKSDASRGSFGVGLINVVRGSTVTIVGGSLLCPETRLWRCLPPSSVGSAIVVTAGGVLWTCTENRPQPLSERAVKLARAASGRLRRSFSLSRP